MNKYQMSPNQNIQLEDLNENYPFKSENQIGFGSFSKVFLTTLKKTNQKISIEWNNNMSTEKDFENIKREIIINKSMVHPYIIKLYDFQFVIQKEFAMNGNLYTYLQNHKLSKSQKGLIFYKVCKAVQYLHANQMIHRDIKPENILLDEQLNPKLGDFGWAVNQPSQRNTFCGTAEYMPPEILESKAQSYPVDIWSLEGKSPFKGDNLIKIFKKIKQQKIQFKRDYDPRAIALIIQMLQNKPSKRLTIKQVLESDYIKSIQKKSKDNNTSLISDSFMFPTQQVSLQLGQNLQSIIKEQSQNQSMVLNFPPSQDNQKKQIKKKDKKILKLPVKSSADDLKNLKKKLKKKSTRLKSPKQKKKKVLDSTNLLLEKSFNYQNFKKKNTQKFINNFKSQFEYSFYKPQGNQKLKQLLFQKNANQSDPQMKVIKKTTSNKKMLDKQRNNSNPIQNQVYKELGVFDKYGSVQGKRTIKTFKKDKVYKNSKGAETYEQQQNQLIFSCIQFNKNYKKCSKSLIKRIPELGNMTQISKSEIKQIKKNLKQNFPMIEPLLDELIPNKNIVFKMRLKDNGKADLIITNDEIICFKHFDVFVPTLRLLHQCILIRSSNYKTLIS